jgi:undecaprenyl-diphosphatase
MDLYQYIILGIVQGLTEFIPVSSSGHLVLIPAVFHWSAPSLVFDAAVHLGTLIAVITVFWTDLFRIFLSWWRGMQHRQYGKTLEARLAWWIIIATIPAVFAGLFFADYIESLFGSILGVAIALMLSGLLIILSEITKRRQKTLAEMTWIDSLLVGVGQAVAIVPGLSRSGTTISVGMLRGMTRESAVRFSFLLSIPIILGANLVQLYQFLVSGGQLTEIGPMAVGLVFAAIFGYLAIRFLLAYLRNRSLFPFAAYCLGIGLISLIFLPRQP